ncbi:hypothetical protein [Streptomyces rochei]|uniref:hypothetical protein n=1 Tax=Streptomyces TaxID=1883 RepID=UPI003528EBCB
MTRSRPHQREAVDVVRVALDTDIVGIDQRLICWQSTRRQQIEDALPVLMARYEQRRVHPPGEKAG